MTRAERMLAAMRRQPVDRTPYCTYNCHPYAGSQHAADPSYAEILERVRTQAGVIAKINLRAGGPALSAARPGRVEHVVEGSGDDRVSRTVLHTPKGDLTSFARTPEKKPSRTMKPLLATDEDMEKYMSIPYEPPEIDAQPVRAFVESAAGGGVPMVMFTEPMYAIVGQMEFEDFSVRCISDPAPVKRMIDWAFERCAENLRRAVAACRGIACVFHTGGPEVCTPPMLAPRFFAELVTPHLRRLNRIIHDGGHLAGVHCHGHVREVLPHILAADVDVLEPVEPPEQGNIPLAELMEQAGGRMCLVGHIQDQEFYTAAPGFMTKRVEAIARVTRGRTGYIMCPTCTPFAYPCPEVYKRNYLEWLEAGERVLNG